MKDGIECVRDTPDSGWMQLRVGAEWTIIEVVGGPFVVFNRRGYAAAMEVKRGQLVHLLYVSAASLAGPLEKIRKARGGSLVGAKVRLRKSGPEMMAPYEVELAE